MKIVRLQNNDYKLGKMVQHREETLIVEMTQEEYQKCCAALYKEEKHLLEPMDGLCGKGD